MFKALKDGLHIFNYYLGEERSISEYFYLLLNVNIIKYILYFIKLIKNMVNNIIYYLLKSILFFNKQKCYIS